MIRQKVLFILAIIFLWTLCALGSLATASPYSFQETYPDGDYPSELYNFLSLLIGFPSLTGFFLIIPVAIIWYRIKFHAAT